MVRKSSSTLLGSANHSLRKPPIALASINLKNGNTVIHCKYLSMLGKDRIVHNNP